MKILGAATKESVLVEMSTTELRTISTWRNPNSESWRLDLYNLGDPKPDLVKEFTDAKNLLDSFRGIGPALLQSAKRLEKLAAEVSLHEPDHSLLPKKKD